MSDLHNLLALRELDAQFYVLSIQELYVMPLWETEPCPKQNTDASHLIRHVRLFILGVLHFLVYTLNELTDKLCF